jgi:hypothetical protein
VITVIETRSRYDTPKYTLRTSYDFATYDEAKAYLALRKARLLPQCQMILAENESWLALLTDQGMKICFDLLIEDSESPGQQMRHHA